MEVKLRAMHLSPLGLLFVLLTSLPGYLLITLSVLLAPNVFLSLLGALLISHFADRLLTRLATRQPENVVERMKRQAVDMMGSIFPGMSETVVNPSIRRLTCLLGVICSAWFSETALAIAIGVFILGTYVEYVEQQRSFLGILSGILTGAIGAAPFAYWLFV